MTRRQRRSSLVHRLVTPTRNRLRRPRPHVRRLRSLLPFRWSPARRPLMPPRVRRMPSGGLILVGEHRGITPPLRP